MSSFIYDKNGKDLFLLYKMDETEAIDGYALSIITSKRMQGIIETEYINDSRGKYFKYKISSMISLKELMKKGVDDKGYCMLLHGIASTLEMFDRNGLNPGSIVLNEELIYYDVNTRNIKFICIPSSSFISVLSSKQILCEFSKLIIGKMHITNNLILHVNNYLLNHNFDYAEFNCLINSIVMNSNVDRAMPLTRMEYLDEDEIKVPDKVSQQVTKQPEIDAILAEEENNNEIKSKVNERTNGKKSEHFRKKDRPFINRSFRKKDSGSLDIESIDKALDKSLKLKKASERLINNAQKIGKPVNQTEDDAEPKKVHLEENNLKNVVPESANTDGVTSDSSSDVVIAESSSKVMSEDTSSIEAVSEGASSDNVVSESIELVDAIAENGTSQSIASDNMAFGNSNSEHINFNDVNSVAIQQNQMGSIELGRDGVYTEPMADFSNNPYMNEAMMDGMQLYGGGNNNTYVNNFAMGNNAQLGNANNSFSNDISFGMGNTSFRRNEVDSSQLGKGPIGKPPLGKGPLGKGPLGKPLGRKQAGRPKMGKQVGSPTMGKQAGSPTMGKQAGSPTMGKQAGSPTMGKQAGSPTMGKQAGSSTMGKQAGSSTMGKQAGSPTMGKRAEDPTMGKQAGNFTTGKQAGSPTMGKLPTGSSTMGKQATSESSMGKQTTGNSPMGKSQVSKSFMEKSMTSKPSVDNISLAYSNTENVYMGNMQMSKRTSGQSKEKDVAHGKIDVAQNSPSSFKESVVSGVQSFMNKIKGGKKTTEESNNQREYEKKICNKVAQVKNEERQQTESVKMKLEQGGVPNEGQMGNIKSSNGDKRNNTVMMDCVTGETGEGKSVDTSVPYLIRVSTGEKIRINLSVFKLGRGRKLVDYYVGGNDTISKVHAYITSKANEYYLVDNGSKNHTYLDGKMLKPVQQELLKHNSKIRLAKEEFVFCLY